MKAPLIAVISVGIAAAAPAVAISASEPKPEPAKAQETSPEPVPLTDPRQAFEPVGFDHKARQTAKDQKLAKRYVQLRRRANRLIARRDHRKARPVRGVDQITWSRRALRRQIRRLRKLIPRLHWDIRARKAGLTPSVKSYLNRIARCESGGNPHAIGGGGTFRGKYQFMTSTWSSVGGKGDPAKASEREQDLRAAILLKRSGGSPWPVCG